MKNVMVFVSGPFVEFYNDNVKLWKTSKLLAAANFISLFLLYMSNLLFSFGLSRSVLVLCSMGIVSNVLGLIYSKVTRNVHGQATCFWFLCTSIIGLFTGLVELL